MKRSELINLIKETVSEVLTEIQTKPSSKVPPALKSKLLSEHKGDLKKVYSIVEAIHKKVKEGNTRVCEMWLQWENKGGEETYVEYVGERQGEEPFTMGGTKWQYVNAKYADGRKDIGVYSFAEDMVYSYDAFRNRFNLKEENVGGSVSYKVEVDNNVYPISSGEIEVIVNKHRGVKMQWLGNATVGSTETLPRYSFMISGPSGDVDALVDELSELGDGIDFIDAVNENDGAVENDAAGHDETDMNNPEENREVELANKIKDLANEILTMHGKGGENTEEPTDKDGDVEIDISDKK